MPDFLQDMIFAALAAVGFSALSRPPRRSYVFTAVIAAVGHGLRYLVMLPQVGMHIVPATALAALAIGLLAVLVCTRSHVPPETYLYPSLLPMIPGIYAYKTFAALAMCLFGSSEGAFDHDFYLFASNGMMTFFILLAMVAGATVPVFMFKKISFRATRREN